MCVRKKNCPLSFCSQPSNFWDFQFQAEKVVSGFKYFGPTMAGLTAKMAITWSKRFLAERWTIGCILMSSTLLSAGKVS